MELFKKTYKKSKSKIINYDVEIYKKAADCKTLNEVDILYRREYKNVSDKEILSIICTNKKFVLMENLSRLNIYN